MIQPSSAQAESVMATAITRVAVTKPPNTPTACCGSRTWLRVLSTTD